MIDPVTLAVIRFRLEQIVDQMAAELFGVKPRRVFATGFFRLSPAGLCVTMRRPTIRRSMP